MFPLFGVLVFGVLVFMKCNILFTNKLVLVTFKGAGAGDAGAEGPKGKGLELEVKEKEIRELVPQKL